jgi:hypothetical protein
VHNSAAQHKQQGKIVDRPKSTRVFALKRIFAIVVARSSSSWRIVVAVVDAMSGQSVQGRGRIDGVPTSVTSSAIIIIIDGSCWLAGDPDHVRWPNWQYLFPALRARVSSLDIHGKLIMVHLVIADHHSIIRRSCCWSTTTTTKSFFAVPAVRLLKSCFTRTFFFWSTAAGHGK